MLVNSFARLCQLCASRRSFDLFAALLLLPPLLGCAFDKPKASAREQDSSPGPIDQINLLAIPVALNFDQRPGPDGFVVKIYAGNRNRPMPVPILSGTVEILMFDGILRGGNAAKPRRTWKYSSEELKTHLLKTSIGTCYQLAPQWGEAKPAGDKISVIAQYASPGGKTLSSAPSVIAVVAK